MSLVPWSYIQLMQVYSYVFCLDEYAQTKKHQMEVEASNY